MIQEKGTNAMIQLKHVSKTFNPGANGGVKALVDVSLEIPKGSIYGIIGFSGAGNPRLFAASIFLSVRPKGLCM